MFALLCAPLASGAGKLAGPKNCRIVDLVETEAEEVKWSGTCKDGFAEGQGKLTWTTENGGQGSFQGTMQHGQAEGAGYLADPGGGQYEGLFHASLPDGMGTYFKLGSGEYNGAFKAGKYHGVGTMVYGTGGRYEGAWEDGERHGMGTATLMNGLVVTGEFRHDVLAGQEPINVRLPEGRYSVAGGQKTGRMSGFVVPPKKSYGTLTRDEKNAVKQGYLLLHDNDEPPYPLHGLEPMYTSFAKAQGKMLLSGNMVVSVLVGSDGAGKSVTVLSSPNPKLTEFVSYVALLEPYKPGLCEGKPCEMRFNFQLNFTMQ